MIMSTAQNLTPLRSQITQQEKLLDIHEAAKLANRKSVTIYHAANKNVGKLHPVRDDSGHLRFKESEIRQVFGDSPVDRRKSQHVYTAPTTPVDFNTTILREADRLLAEISVMESTIASMKNKYLLLEPLVKELRK